MCLNTSKVLWVFIRTTMSYVRKVHFFADSMNFVQLFYSQALYRYKVLTAWSL
jgi:hypothetical protein